MNKRTLALFATLLLLAGGGAFGDSAPGDDQSSRSGRLKVNLSPYEKQLDKIRDLKDTGNIMLWCGLSGSFAGFVGSSTVLTMGSLNYISNSATTAGEIATYSFTAASVAVLVWGFLQWYDNSNRYEDTQRLASNYFNEVN